MVVIGVSEDIVVEELVEELVKKLEVIELIELDDD